MTEMEELEEAIEWTQKQIIKYDEAHEAAMRDIRNQLQQLQDHKARLLELEMTSRIDIPKE